MKSSSGSSGSGSMILGIITLVLSLASIGALVYLFVHTFKQLGLIDTSILEIKSKIGSMIKDINSSNKTEFSIEMEQQQSINNLVSRLS
jgi:hypothetical protein